MCKLWREYDDERGNLYEYCSGAKRRVVCCGEERYCQYPAELQARAEARKEVERDAG